MNSASPIPRSGGKGGGSDAIALVEFLRAGKVAADSFLSDPRNT